MWPEYAYLSLNRYNLGAVNIKTGKRFYVLKK